MKTRSIFLAIAAVTILQDGIRAHSESIPWFTVDGGAGTSSGAGTFGAFALTGTIGQTDAGPALVGGGFSVTGGFWSFLGNTAPAPPALRIRLIGTSAVISWPNPSTGFELQEAAALLGATTLWSNVNQSPTVVGGDKQVTVSATSNWRFYRLRKP